MSAKWGVFGRSFNDIGNAVTNKLIDFNDEFERTGKLFSSWNNTESIFDRLYPTDVDVQSQIIDVDALFPEIDTDTFDFDYWISGLNEIDKKVSSGTISWQDYSDSLEKNQKWIAQWGQETQGTIRTQEKMIEGNKQARQTALAHNEALKQQTLSAKVASVAMSLLSTAANALISIAITKLITAWDDYKDKLRETAEEMSEVAEKSADNAQSLLDLQKQLDDDTISAEDLTSAFREQMRAMGYTETQIDSLIGKYGNLAGAINEATEEALNNAKTDAYADMTTSGKSLTTEAKGNTNVGFNYAQNKELSDEIAKMLADSPAILDGGVFRMDKNASAEEIYEYYLTLKDISRLIQETAKETGDDSLIAGDMFNPTPYYQVSEALDALSESAELYGDAIDRLHSADAQLELSNYLKTNDIDSKEAFDTYVNGIKNSKDYSEAYKQVLLEVANDAFPQFSTSAKDASDSLGDFANETGNLSYEEQLSGVEYLSKGLDQLSDIYKDVKDAGDFDWSSILNKQEFIDAFDGCGDAYDEFIKTITNSPDDIEACQTAFNNLATEYIYNSGVLDDLTEETKDATVAMLEQMGVTNALEVVEGHLAINTGKLAAEQELLALTSKDVTEATYQDIEALILKGQVAGTTAQYLAQLAFQKLDLNNLKINTVDDVNNIIAIAKAAGTSEEYINKLRTALINLMNASGGSSGSNRNNNISLGKRDDIDTPSTDDGNAENSKLIVDDILGDIVSGFDDINIADFYDGIDFGGGSSSGSGGSSAKESAKVFDWIETKLSRLQRTIKNFGKTVSATYLTWSTRNDALLSEIAAVNEELVTQQKAYETYMAMANSVGLSDEYKQLVQSGDLRIDSITDETLKKQIELYTQYYEAALDCSDAIQDLTDSLAELARQKFDNISAEFDSIMSTATSQMDLINAYIDLAEAKGHLVSTNYYETLKELEQQNKESLQSEYNALQQAMEEAIASGVIKEGSQEHKEMEEAIADVKKEIIEADIALQEYENTIRELEWEVFDKMQEAMSQVTEESDFLMELMSNDKMHDENGNLTDEGQAVMGLHAMNYNAYMAQADEYAKELQKIDEEIANDPNNQELLERRQELLESQREMILAAEDEKQAMLDLIREGYDAMLSSMEDLIQKKKDMFKEMSDMYDFEKNIKKQVEELDKLRKQLLAYQGDNSEGAKANIQKLEEEIRIAEENLQETEYDKYISDVEKMLDTFYSNTEQWISEQMEKEAELLQGIIDETNANAVTIKETLETQVGAVGTSLSEAMKSIWNTDGNGSAANVVSMYGDALNGTMTTVSSTLESIKALIASMVTASDETAESDIEDVVPSEPSSPKPTEPVSPPEPEEPVTPSEPTQEWGHWFIPKQNQVPLSRLNTESSIVDRLKARNFDSSMSARTSYYAAMGGSGQYTGSASQNRWMIEQMKAHGFAKGGTIGSLIKSTGEDGFVLARTGEEILSLDKIKELGFAFEKMNPIIDTIRNLPMSSIHNAKNIDLNVSIGDIQMYGVNDPKQFATQLKDTINNDSSVRKIVNDVTLGNALGRNSLTRYTR